jgi:hypothetical protein
MGALAGMSTIDPSRQGHAFNVEVRRPLHRPAPHRRLRQRWSARSDRRRLARAERKNDGAKLRWWDALDFPGADLEGVGAIVLAVVAAFLLVLFVAFAGPILWIVVLFFVEMLVWFVLAVAGLTACLVLGRPWQVVITDPDGVLVASVPVRGRRRAREHAATVAQRLAQGASPSAAVTTH